MTRRSFESDSFDFGIRRKKSRCSRGKIVALATGLHDSFLLKIIEFQQLLSSLVQL